MEDELSWRKEYGFPCGSDVDVETSKESSFLASAFDVEKCSVGNFFKQKSDEVLDAIFSKTSPERKEPVPLIDVTNTLQETQGENEDTQNTTTNILSVSRIAKIISSADSQDSPNKIINYLLKLKKAEVFSKDESVSVGQKNLEVSDDEDLLSCKSSSSGECALDSSVEKLDSGVDVYSKRLEVALKVAKLSQMKAKEELPAQMKPLITWDELQAASTSVQPKTFGKRAMATHNAQKALTLHRLHELHGSIETCPTEDTLATDPKGLRIELMEHQKQALAWLKWRENQKPSGGILADDMGLGKTLTMISLILKQREHEDSKDSADEEDSPHNRRHKYKGGSLIVCPASVLKQWEEEVKKHCKRYLLSVEYYHGPKRETRAQSLAKYDMVMTTYTICLNEYERSTPINSIYWRRIILDEAHAIKNFKCTTSKAVRELSAKSRWVLTGTPIHNKELDMYSLLKFLRCSPFDDIAVWKRCDKTHGGQERLHTVLAALMLRRTKQQLQEKGALTCLPDRRRELIEITLSKAETNVYQKVLIFSRTLFAQFLHQRAEKETDRRETFNYDKGNDECHKMHKMLLKLNKVRTVKQHDIFVLLLRLRQICCHPSLITGMLQAEDKTELGDDDEHQDEMNILEQLNKLNLDDDFDTSLQNLSINNDKENDSLAQNCRTLLNSTNPVFGEEYKSSKIQAVIKKLKECILQNEDKAVVVSQFAGFLKIIATNLKKENIYFLQLYGSVPVLKRKDIVADFNNPRHPTKILLLSLTGGFILKHISVKSLSKCEMCLRSLQHSGEADPFYHKFVTLREYDEAKRLQYMNVNIIKGLIKINFYLLNIFPSVIYSTSICKRLVSILRTEINLEFEECPHAEEIKHHIFTIFVKIYIYSYLKKLGNIITGKEIPQVPNELEKQILLIYDKHKKRNVMFKTIKHITFLFIC